MKNITNGPQKDRKKDQHVCSTKNPYENIVISTDPNAKHFVEDSQMNFVNFADIQFVNVKRWHQYKHKKEFQTYVLYMNYINKITNCLMNILLKNEKQIFQCYHEYLNVFSKNKINELFVHDSQDHAINIKKKEFFFGKLYNLSQTELIALRDYLKKHLKKKFIVSSISSAKAFVIFVKKKNDELRLCVNYQKLNVITKKNRHSLSFIEKALDRLIGVKKYIKLNIQHAYNLI